ncbi:hypothetical protein PV05_05666 [Exophiala xenobiotica]|uniref:Uncharacterized protein n=1 Tax=Exophiala xenobiotica TaxID=348802 RepID=A0A0D2D405_9EURO|nr:uncharacterized protein PV05_05666 [Exophiala xenobiotica]KIW57062.1 hypothetical protein PV05_05666 [Exophiala xenobiotica]
MDAPTILIVSLPAKTFLGLDLVSFTSSPNFHGITKVPPGLHFLYTGTDASLSIRHGRWLHIVPSTPPQVLQWDPATETLDLLDPNCAPARSAINSLSSRGLVDYTALQDATSDLASRDASANSPAPDAETGDERADSTDWPSLISHISPHLLTRVLSTNWAISSISSAPSDTESIPGLSHLEASNALHQSPLNLVPVNLKQTWADADIGRTRTDRARDRSWYLSHLVDTVTLAGKDKAVGAREILGEVQFCFLMVLTLANYSCLEQWKRLLSVLLTCQAALDEVQGYFVEVVRVLAMQVRHFDDVEGGMFEMREEGGSAWLRSVWGRLRAVVEDAFSRGEDEAEGKGKGKGTSKVGEQGLKKEVENLQKLFEDKYGWTSEKDVLRRGMLELEDGERIEVSMAGVDEDEETGEYAPVIVDT